MTAIAHSRATDNKEQTLAEHLNGVADLASQHASKIGCSQAGEMLGLLHDLGKYSSEFQAYIASAIGKLDPDEDEDYVDAKQKKGKVDHSTAGAQWIFSELSKRGECGKIVGEILGIAVASHHSGLIDCLTASQSHEVENNFSRRMEKSSDKTHIVEIIPTIDNEIRIRIAKLLADPQLETSIASLRKQIIALSPEKNEWSFVAQFQIGLLVRFLFSCLIDADRQNTADFESPHRVKARLQGYFESWDELIQRLDSHLLSFTSDTIVDKIRQKVSNSCYQASQRQTGLFTLTVPTGGGKTLASLRFALHHAKKHGLERVIYVIPFTSIIDQNADATRKILDPNEQGNIVLEHHSNLEPEKTGWKNKLLAENWDAPIVYTTSVQLLETLFGGGTRGVRRMHQLTKSLIIFDEIQTMPVKCIHMFNNAINFLVDHCGSSVVFCTATQPLLGDSVSLKPQKGVAKLNPNSEIIPDVHSLYSSLKRVEVHDLRKNGGWNESEVAELAIRNQTESQSCLIIVNTKKSARKLFQAFKPDEIQLYHLSTSMCPTHRRKILATIRKNLSEGIPTICVSTQLIEAGVDVDFGSVIRYLAGLDSIAQAAGRCNRNGRRQMGSVYVVNPASENTEMLEDISIGLEKSQRVLDDFHENPNRFDNDLLSPKAMTWFYQNYFFKRKEEMAYRVGPKIVGRDDSLLNMLSVNKMAISEYCRIHKKNPERMQKVPRLLQSFMTANKAFQTIDAPTKAVVVQYGDNGRRLVGELCATFELEKQYTLHKKAQQYSVNLYSHEFEDLAKKGVIHEAQEGSGIYYLNERYYSEQFGLSLVPVTEEELLLCQ